MSILKLKVTSYHRLTPGQVVEQSYTEQGGSIGRSAKSDWVLPDPDKVISSIHAYVNFQSGQFYITDNSTNGLFVNRSVQPLGKGNSQALSDGDYLQLGDYEVEVAVETRSASAIPAHQQSGVPEVTPNHETSVSGSNSVDRPPQQQTHSEAISQDPYAENFTPPMAQIPEDWDANQQQKADKEGSSKVESTPSSPIPPEPQPAVNQAVIDSEHTQQTESQNQVTGNSGFSQSAGYESVQKPIPPSPAQHNHTQEANAQIHVQQQAEPQHATPARSARSVPAPSAAGSASFDSISNDQAKSYLTSFLNAAGLREEDLPRDVSPALFEAMGGALRFSLQGMLDILRARSDMKSEFRVLQTTIRTQENNPLKFSINVDEAMRNLFLRQVPGFLPWFQAIESCFKDMSTHELALMAGTQGALQGVLDTLNPEDIARANQSDSALHKVLPATKKAKLWDIFVTLHGEAQSDVGQGSDKTFSEEFGAAYEAQLRKLGVN